MGNKVSKCIIISAAPHSDVEFYKDKIQEDDFIICADGGYIHAQDANIVPNLIVGDFDSSSVPDSDIETIILPTNKNDTDTMYAVREGIGRGYKKFVFLSAIGGRADHTFANYSALFYLKHHGCSGEILSCNSKIFLLENEQIEIRNQSDKIFSIFPFACRGCLVSLNGFRYPLLNYTINAEFPIGVSNIITSDEAFVSVGGGCAIVYMTDQ